MLSTRGTNQYDPITHSFWNKAFNPAGDLFEMRRVSVGGGALEVQRNILAKRTLDLPS